MAKVEIIGPRDLLPAVIEAVRDLAVFQVEPACTGFVEPKHQDDIRSFSIDEHAGKERTFLEGLALSIDQLLGLLPSAALRETYLDPSAASRIIAGTVSQHLEKVMALTERREALTREKTELERHALFLESIGSMLGDEVAGSGIEFIGFTIKEPESLPQLRDAVSRITDWKFDFRTEPAADGTLFGLITVEKDLASRVKDSLSRERVPELSFPAEFDSLPFPQKVRAVRQRIADNRGESERIERTITCFGRQWLPLYRSVLAWINDRLSLMNVAASAFETRLCFCINGWIPAEALPPLRQRLAGQYGGGVVVVEREIRAEDLERVPIMLKNPPSFKPFEILTRLLPLPAYTSYDPTPFIAVFFPLFFGMILGDAGYGAVIAAAAAFMARRWKANDTVASASRIILAASGYAVVFGILYGEFFGDLPQRLFGMKPLLVERREAVLPMALFAVAVGAGHVLFGLLLGARAAYRRGSVREAAYRGLSVLAIIGVLLACASVFGMLPPGFGAGIAPLFLVVVPLLLLTGGLLAPLELLKSIGSIVSYVRIMAIGLTSVLLAFSANRLAGLAGNLFAGILIAGMLHLLNIVLGVFSPSIHALRLHYVEFFGKFLEHGGREFTPLRRTG